MIKLTGLEGQNLLAYLAALGLLRTLDRVMSVTMSWESNGPVWYPVLHCDLGGEDDLLDTLADLLKNAPPLGDLDANLKLNREQYRAFASGNHEWGAALASDAVVFKDIVKKSSWILIGAAQQRIIPTFVALAKETNVDKLRRALFHPWDYQDKGKSLRLDPADQKDYALQWGDPSADGAHTMHAACRLAVEALPMLPVIPTPRHATLGISDGWTATWAIWSGTLSARVVSALVGMEELVGEIDRAALSRRGIVEVYRCRKQSVGKYQSFQAAAPV
jgi:hypothetical protein